LIHNKYDDIAAPINKNPVYMFVTLQVQRYSEMEATREVHWLAIEVYAGIKETKEVTFDSRL